MHTHPSDSGRCLLGGALVCTVTIISRKDWPVTGASVRNTISDGMFQKFSIEVFKANARNELWWAAGEITRALISYVLENVVIVLIFDVAIPYTDLNWAFLAGAIWLLGRLVTHVTKYWAPSSWAVGYNITLDWILKKWAALPAPMTHDLETERRYRGMIDMVTSKFCGSTYVEPS